MRRLLGGGRPRRTPFPVDRTRLRRRIRQVGYAQGRYQDHGIEQSESVSSAATPRSVEEYHLAVAHGHDAALSIHKLLSGEDITERPLPDVQISSQKMGIHEWSYDNDVSSDKRNRCRIATRSSR